MLQWQPCYFESFEDSLYIIAFTSYCLCSFIRQCFCLKMHLHCYWITFLFTIMPSLPRTVLTLCFMSSVNAATPVDQPVHCSHLSIKCFPVLVGGPAPSACPGPAWSSPVHISNFGPDYGYKLRHALYNCLSSQCRHR